MTPQFYPDVPYPPTGGSMDPTLNLIFLVSMWLIAGLFFIFALRALHRDKSPVFLLCLVGGGLCCLIEPIVDVMGLCWFWQEGNWFVGEWMGRFIPSWIVPVYIWYVGGQCYYTLTRLEKGISTSGLWKLYGLYAAANILLEEPPLHLGLYTYYGAQPLQIGLLPLWWIIVNAAMPVVAAVAIYKLKPHLRGWKILAIIPTMPMCDALANAAIGWPVWLTLNSSDSLIITHLGALATLLLAMLMIHYLSLVATVTTSASNQQTGISRQSVQMSH